MTNLSGEGNPDLHPAVQEFFNRLPVRLREPFLGYCAESALVSDQLWGLDSARPDGNWTTLEEAIPYFSGSSLIAVKIRDEGDPEHGENADVCRSCGALLDKLGITVVPA